MRVLGVITARGGSAGVPRKNVRVVGGRPLIAWSILAAQSSARLTRTVVSTDDDEIASVAKAHGADVPFVRPAELATATAASVDVAVHALDHAEAAAQAAFDAVMILQPTSPLRTGADIDACVDLLAHSGADSVMSMVQLADFSLKKLKVLKDGRILPLLPAEAEGPLSRRRDEEAPVYRRNCAVYLTRTSVLRRRDLFGDESRAYVMPAERSVDINSEHDLQLADWLLSRRQRE